MNAGEASAMMKRAQGERLLKTISEMEKGVEEAAAGGYGTVSVTIPRFLMQHIVTIKDHFESLGFTVDIIQSINSITLKWGHIS